MRRQGGFTLIEIMIVVVILATMLAAVWGTSSAVQNSVVANSRSAEVMTLVRATMRRTANFVRPGKLSTIQVQATAADVAAALATAVGEWIFPPPPPDMAWRAGIRFQSASGTESMNAALSTLPRELTFAIEPGEKANGLDDDGDGLIDEGTLQLLHDNVTVAVINNVEECAFRIDGRLLGVRLRCGVGSRNQPTVRAQVEQNFYLRNN